MNNNIAGELVAHLEEEAEAYQGLYRLLREERDALVQWSIGDLSDIVEKKETQLEEIHQLEERRTTLLDSIQAALEKAGLGSLDGKENLTLSDIIKAVKQEKRKQLITIQKELTRLVREVTTTNHTNQMLLKRSYELVNANLNIYKQSEKLAQTYGANGEYRSMETSHLVDGSI